MRRDHRAAIQEIDGEIAVGNGVETVLRGLTEAKVGGERETIDRDGRSRERPGPQRTDVEPFKRFNEAAAVAFECPEMREPPMAEQDPRRWRNTPG